MLADNNSVSDGGRISPERVVPVLQALLRGALADGINDDQLERLSGVKARAIKSYRVDGKQPRLSSALSLAVALGPDAVNAVMAIIGYVATPLEGGPTSQPMELVAGVMQRLSTIATAASDNHFDHIEKPTVEGAADDIIEILTPISSRSHTR